MNMEAIKAEGMAKTSWKHDGQLFSELASNDHYCHLLMASLTLMTFYPALLVRISLQK